MDLKETQKKELIETFGTYKFKNLSLTTTQQPYIDGPVGDAYYCAHAIDGEENDYMIYWDILPGQKDAEDESFACDWENPSRYKRD